MKARAGVLVSILAGVVRSAVAAANFAASDEGLLPAPIIEASGIVASRNNPGVLWIHNDSEDGPAKIYALNLQAKLLAAYRLPEVEWGDFEDIAIGPGPAPIASSLYLGDIGDNFVNRSSIVVYRIPEPCVYPYWQSAPLSLSIENFKRYTLSYPDGPHDAEAMMVDPLTGDLFIGTKETNRCAIYKATKAQLEATNEIPLSLEIAITNVQFVSAGDISPSGNEIILRNENMARLWVRNLAETIGEALARSPLALPVIGEPVEPNGEGIAFNAAGTGYFTVSEETNQPLYFFQRVRAIPADQSIQLISSASLWRYSDDGMDQGRKWRLRDFDDSHWQRGAGKFGYGHGGEQAILSFGPDESDKTVTSYFRKSYFIDDVQRISSLVLRIVFDDGFAVYLNDTEAARMNLVSDAAFDDVATAANSNFENVWLEFSIPPSWLRNGINTLSVEVHRQSRQEEDLSFDLQLLAAEDQAQRCNFVSLPERSEGAWRLDLGGPIDRTVAIEASSNLTHWFPLGTVTLTNGSGTFLDSSAGAVRFYRLKEASAVVDAPH